jgi:hypothetical protein
MPEKHSVRREGYRKYQKAYRERMKRERKAEEMKYVYLPNPRPRKK